MRLSLTLLSLLGAMAEQATAQVVSLERPSDCTPVLTVQFRGCQVETFLDCGTLSNPIYRNESYDATGLTIVSHTTSDGFIIGVLYPIDDFEIIGIPDGALSTPIAEVLATGQSEFKQDVEVRMFGNFRRPARIESTATRNGDQELGVLEVFNFETVFLMPPPMDPITALGKSYHYPELELWIEGETTISWPSDSNDEIPKKPARLIHPGEPGFDTTTPEFDCNQLSLLSSPTVSRHS
jgi:hypothetical protein